uniref:Mitogen-activated protein kinase kinase kinase kinase n=1 Tax=Panagrellus redivivus TaxID=6233 RepID=A0A7E4VGJ3_PANRE
MSAAISHADPTLDYELIQRVGIGSFGEVFKARHLRSDQLAAVKVVKLEQGDNFTVIQQEIHMLRDCVHPNIISYYASYFRRDKLWIVMEYCSGGSLQDIYQLSGPLLELQIAFVCRETLKGLAYLHRRGKVHRDIKGANILLTENGNVKLADFGVAAQITATLGKRKSFIGTPYWMAPEVASVEQRGGYGVECDIWAVGITAIEVAELQPPNFEFHPMQVLYMMTKSSYKPPRLKDKSRWSANMHDFVKCCLTKNPKKRPSPDKLLSSHNFVKGALSSRVTRELLDKLNNCGRPTPREENTTPTLVSPESLSEIPFDDDTSMSGLSRKPSIASSSSGDAEPVSNGYHPPIRGGMVMSNSQSHNGPFTDKGKNGTIVSDLKSSASHDAVLSEASAVSAPPVTTSKARARVEQALRLTAKSFKPKHNRTASLGSPPITLRTVDENHQPKHHRFSEFEPRAPQSHSDRPSTSSIPSTGILGLPPTPKVSMGACFFSIFHGAELEINCSATWVHPTTLHQYAVLGAEEGIYMLDLYELHESRLIQIYPSRCSWLYILDNVMMSQHGKTPYLYRHDLVQLVQQTVVAQKISKRMSKIPEVLKPKVLLATTRIPETKDVVQCCVRRSAINDNLYLCCSVPGAMLLYQWYPPQAQFMLIKRHDLERSSLKLAPTQPFELIFKDGQNSCDYPFVCHGVYRRIDEIGNEASGFDLQLVNFNDHGKVADFLLSSRDFDVFGASTLSMFTSRKFDFNPKLRISPVALRQLEKDTLMLVYDKQVVLLTTEGNLKAPGPIRTKLEFDFDVEYAVALSDSVLAFHRHGVQGRSFADGSVTQDLNDDSKEYSVVQDEPVITLKSRSSASFFPSTTPSSKTSTMDYSRASTLAFDATLKRPETDLDATLTPSSRPPSMLRINSTSPPHTPKSATPVSAYDLCILTGHVSTLEDDAID